MVDVKRTRAQKQMEAVSAELFPADIDEYSFTRENMLEAERWIKKQGYHLRYTNIWNHEDTQKPYAAIRLEKNAYTIINVYTDCPEHGCVKDVICYAAMLLYQRLKRDKVIA